MAREREKGRKCEKEKWRERERARMDEWMVRTAYAECYTNASAIHC